MTLLAYHNNPKVKSKYLNRVQAHARADEIVHGQYWENGRGCAVGCSIHGSDHMKYETELGIPVMLARLEDCIFEGMNNGESQKFPAQFLKAIRPGADLSLVGPKFLHWLVSENLKKFHDHPIVGALAESAQNQKYIDMRDKLLELLRAA